jgi:hypothetical protein
MRALPGSSEDLAFLELSFGMDIRALDTLLTSQPEDRATLESDPSAALEAEMGGWRKGLPPLRFFAI